MRIFALALLLTLVSTAVFARAGDGCTCNQNGGAGVVGSNQGGTRGATSPYGPQGTIGEGGWGGQTGTIGDSNF